MLAYCSDVIADFGHRLCQLSFSAVQFFAPVLHFNLVQEIDTAGVQRFIGDQIVSYSASGLFNVGCGCNTIPMYG